MILEHDGAAAMLQQVRRGGGGLQHRARRRQVAAQHRDAAAAPRAACRRAGSPRRSSSRRRWQFSQIGLAVDRQRVLVQQAAFAQRAHAPPAGRRRSRNPPSGTGPTASGRRASARRGRAGPSRRASDRHADAAGDGQQVDDRIGRAADRALTRMAFSNASRVRIFDSRRSSFTISTMRRPARCASA